MEGMFARKRLGIRVKMRLPEDRVGSMYYGASTLQGMGMNVVGHTSPGD